MSAFSVLADAALRDRSMAVSYVKSSKPNRFCGDRLRMQLGLIYGVAELGKAHFIEDIVELFHELWDFTVSGMWDLESNVPELRAIKIFSASLFITSGRQLIHHGPASYRRWIAYLIREMRNAESPLEADAIREFICGTDEISLITRSDPRKADW